MTEQSLEVREQFLCFFRFSACMPDSRLQNSRFFFSKAVKKSIKFFLKISKEIGKAWRKSLEREARERKAREKRLSPLSLSVFNLVPDLSFDCSRVLEYAKIRTVLHSSRIASSSILFSCLQF